MSVFRNLLFMSAEATNSRADCGFGGVPDPVSKERVRGIRIFDIRDIEHPALVTSVQTCRGSHTHTVVTQPGDDQNVYIYVSGTSRVRSADELPGCEDGGIDDPNTARFRLEVIKVPLAAPQQAAIVSSPRIFNGLPVPPRNADRDAIDAAARAARAAARGGAGRGGAGAPGGEAAGRGRGRGGDATPTGPNQCHDITVYPEIGLAGGACAGLGLLLDIRDAAHPVRLDAASDANMSFWHSATFSNDGSKILFTDEWGGGSQPRCRDTDKMDWGADALFTIENNKLVFHTYYKMPAAQTSEENCVAHNGSLIPIPGREVMVQSWYQGGVSVFDWTDVDHPKEIAYFDRGPMNAERLVDAGTWSAYWYNGVIVSSEIARGLDIYELVPSGLITENELAAAKTVKVDYWNTQDQRKFVWPPSFALARAYLDQLQRSNGLAADRIAAARTTLASAERQSGSKRRAALVQLASTLGAGADSGPDAAKVHAAVHGDHRSGQRAFLILGALPLGLPDTRARPPLRRRAPCAWLARGARSRFRLNPRAPCAWLARGARSRFRLNPRAGAPRTPRHARSPAAAPARYGGDSEHERRRDRPRQDEPAVCITRPHCRASTRRSRRLRRHWVSSTTIADYPTNQRRDGGYRSLRVDVARSDVQTRARAGYRVPSR